MRRPGGDVRGLVEKQPARFGRDRDADLEGTAFSVGQRACRLRFAPFAPHLRQRLGSSLECP